MHSRADAACFDATAITRLESLLAHEGRTVIEAFIDECLGSVANLLAQAENVAAGSAVDLRGIVHTLATHGAYVGAEELARWARDIERRTATDAGADVGPLIRELRPAYERFLHALERERIRPPAAP